MSPSFGGGTGTPIVYAGGAPTGSKAIVEYLLLKSIWPMLTAAGMEDDDYGGFNADLNGPIGHAIRDLGYGVANPVSVSDADVSQVADNEFDGLLDIAELYTLEAVLGHLDDVDIAVGPRSEKLSQLAAQVERKIERLSKKCTKMYGHGLGTPVTGVFSARFAEHG